MAWTTPTTVNAGEVLTAALWTSDVQGNTNDLRSYQNRYAEYRRTAGNITLTGTTTWSTLTTIGTAGDLTLNATAGDVIEGIAMFAVGGENVELIFDWVTVVSGTVTNSFSLNAAAPAAFTNLDRNVYYKINGSTQAVPGSLFRTLTAGDISAGTVTVRLRYATGAATNRTLFAGTVSPFTIAARNHGPVTT
jgi:hypothetical protein